MEKDKLYILRRTLSILCFILFVATFGIILIKTQIKRVKLDYYGKIVEINTLSYNVSNFLTQNNISLGDNDVVEPSVDSAIKNDSIVKIYAKKELAKIDIDEISNKYTPIIAKIEEVIEDIPFSEENVDNDKLEKGKTNVVQEGENGKKSTTFVVRYENNEEVERKHIQTNVIQEAKNKVVEIGTKVVLASRSQLVQNLTAMEVPSTFKKYNISLPEEQQEYAYKICQQYGIEYELFLAVMYKESGFNPNSIGGGNSYGLCQIHISNHSNLTAKLGVTNFLDPYDNMTAGAYLLSNYLNSARKVVSGDSAIVYALNSYNMGEGIYFNTCYSKGILDRAYSTSVITIRNKLISAGGI